MSEELKEKIQQLTSYYRQHGISKMIETKPGFVAEDFSKLLADLEIEMEQK